MRAIVGALLLVCVSSISARSLAKSRQQPTGAHSPAKSKEQPVPGWPTVPKSTFSPAARNFLQEGLVNLENGRTDKALENWHAAEQADPRFAFPHLFISEFTTDSREQASERAKAENLARGASIGERLWIRWLVQAQESHYISAIASMNDLLARYPRDKQLLFFAGRWLVQREQYAHATRLLERAVTVDAGYAPAWSRLGYAYAQGGDFRNAFSAMERYVSLRPNDPAPHEAYAQILRMAGNFQGALDHYRTALRFDPNFRDSQSGIADTYALMGEEDTARKEYAKAIQDSKNRSEFLGYEIKSGLTYVREKKYSKANSIFQGIADEAHKLDLKFLESEAYRMMALFEPNDDASLKHSDKALFVLQTDQELSRVDSDEQQAYLLRIRAVRAAQAKKTDVSEQSRQKLMTLANSSRSERIRHNYGAALGAVLAITGKYKEAIPYLEEDSGNPLSMQQLVMAYSKVGDNVQAHLLELKLAAFNQPTIEQALVVPPLRAKLAASNPRKSWFLKFTARAQ